ncbi:MAG TPA: hypothetical protein DCS88_11180 [Alphaproteobacteria bacterium]|nr:hypothetical protein [Alphaproteobacteria bacterium]
MAKVCLTCGPGEFTPCQPIQAVEVEGFTERLGANQGAVIQLFPVLGAPDNNEQLQLFAQNCRATEPSLI